MVQFSTRCNRPAKYRGSIDTDVSAGPRSLLSASLGAAAFTGRDAGDEPYRGEGSHGEHEGQENDGKDQATPYGAPLGLCPPVAESLPSIVAHIRILPESDVGEGREVPDRPPRVGQSSLMILLDT